MRSAIIASILLMLVSGVLAGCGESSADKAQAQVCDARDDIRTQVDDLQGLTLTTATTSQVKDDLQAIQSDLKTIANATGDLSDERRQDVQAANDAFTAKLQQIRQELGSDLSAEGAAAQAKAALQELADSYRQTFGELDCS